MLSVDTFALITFGEIRTTVIMDLSWYAHTHLMSNKKLGNYQIAYNEYDAFLVSMGLMLL